MEVALKFLSKDNLRDQKALENTLNERNLMLQIDHLFVLKLIEAFQTETYLIYVLECMPFGDLSHQLYIQFN
jgi:serine/threonine protein kinase